MSFSTPRGMRDFYPEEFQKREALFSVWRESAKAYGFLGYDAPVVETLDLLKRKGGEEISRQIYEFEDKSGRKLALRPEMTPSLARMIVARQGQLAFPLKWTTIAQCFRYERMTRGRKREHFQWNLDIVGESSIMAEVEVIGAAVEAMRRLGLTGEDFKVRIGSRALLSALFDDIKIDPEHFEAACLALDKRGKIGDEETEKLLTEEGLNAEAIERVFELLGIESLDQAADRLGNDCLAVCEMRELFSIAEAMGFDDCLVVDLGIVRGLGYYTGIVFEAFDTKSQFRALFGGGRYDNLLTALGGQPCPSVGIGFGDVVIQELLDELGKPLGEKSFIDYTIGAMNDECMPLAQQTAAALRRKGQNVELGLSPEKPKKFFTRADKCGTAFAVYIGPDEIENGKLRAKRMVDGTQLDLDLEALPSPD